MCVVWAFLRHVWLTDGVSEFIAAMIGGGFAIGTQQLAIRHDRKKELVKAEEEKKARAWGIYFKISMVHEALTFAKQDINAARKISEENGAELWQFLQFPPHDWKTVDWDVSELMLLMDNKQFDIMQRYQEVTLWLSNFIQSSQFYREMRVEFLRSCPSTVSGDQGVMALGQEELNAIMPTIVHLRSLANSLDSVIATQQPDVRKLLVDYTDLMQSIIGRKPNLEFLDEVPLEQDPLQ